MAIRMPCIIQAKQILRRSLSNGRRTPSSTDIPKGYFAIYVGEQEKKRHVVSLSILSEPLFQDLLHQAEEEYGYSHPTGGLMIPFSEEVFAEVTSRFGAL
ncbi:auxin-induced protein X15-like [Bidens hawaiensis]|uniref:auxin-induced protein X15-like n=1 Tax=Bidens hawaiensis TaxID=980011 RepID=UPI00404ACC50